MDQLPSLTGRELLESARISEGPYTQKGNRNKMQGQQVGAMNGDVKDQKEEFKKVAKEMESLFAYQLLKVMRETNDNFSEDNGGIGQDTYMGLFDMEVSKMFADRGLGMQENIVSWLERSAGINNNEK